MNQTYNFTRIRDQYPTAFEALCKWIPTVELRCGQPKFRIVEDGKLMLDYDTLQLFLEPRLCFDFFDSVGIQGVLHWDFVYCAANTWSYDVYNEGGMWYLCDDRPHFDSRTTAEHACWTRMFQILNEQLEGKG